MIDIVDSAVHVQNLLPTHRQLISDTVSKTLGLGQTKTESVIEHYNVGSVEFWYFLLAGILSTFFSTSDLLAGSQQKQTLKI